MQRPRGSRSAEKSRSQSPRAAGFATGRQAGAAEPEPFRVEVQPEREWVRVVAVGEVDLATAPVLGDCLSELIDVGFTQLKLDLGHVSFLDCAGLRVVIGAWSRAQQTGARLDVLRARGQVARLFALAIADEPSLAVGWTARASRIGAPVERIVDNHSAPATHTCGPRRRYEPLAEAGRPA